MTDKDPQNPFVGGPVEVQEAHRIWTDRRLTIFLLVLVVLLGGFEAARFTNSIHSRHKIDTTAQILQKVDDTANIIKKATSPEAQAAGAAAYARAIDSIDASTQQVASVAIYCARSGGDVPTISDCVSRELAKVRSTTP